MILETKRRGGMGVTAILLFAPALAIMIVSIVLQGGNLTSAGGNNVGFCSGNGCVPAGSSTVITCNAPVGSCKILPGCSNPPPPAYCFPWPFSLLPTNSGTFLPAGQTVILTSSQENSALTTSAALFQFGAIGVSGFTVIILVTVGIVVLASITILNSGMGAEGVHILAVSGVVLGIWVILSAIDGFITGNPNSLFSSLNNINIAGTGGYAGTLLYVVLSLSWTFGWLASFTRGA